MKTKTFTWTCGQEFKAYLLKDGRIKITTTVEADYGSGIFSDEKFSKTFSISTIKKLLALRNWTKPCDWELCTTPETCVRASDEFAMLAYSNELGNFLEPELATEQKQIMRKVLRYLGV